ncbi:MAG: hypothetical protein L3J74_00015 [Bacteroidales bacterium]|nr:hypothetical protein [Bacteroidales bacterium]
MQFLNFKQQFNKYIVFSVKEIDKLYPNFNKMNLLTWQKKGYLHKIRNSWYCFSDTIIDETRLFYIANKIYQPSYVSLETALYYYGVIPEAVFSINSVTTLKTKEFKNSQYLYTYRNIKTNCFFAYKFVQKENYTFKIAEIEKALLDLLYFRHSLKTFEDIISLRLNKELLLKELNMQKLSDYATLYNSKILLKKVKIINQFLYD